jgi:two-component system nitrogen regulation response regulator GlnG
MLRAARELEVEPKSINKNTQKVLNQLDWPGNVRQLENLCRWLTVMASGKEVLAQDLPPELHQPVSLEVQHKTTGDWQTLLAAWTDQQLRGGQSNILSDTTPEFEKIMLDRALHYTRGRKQEAAKLLGWGRNTLTRKLKEFDM